MTEKPGAVTFLGNPLTLIGDELEVGSSAPAFEVVDGDLNPVGLGDYAGKVCVVVTVPSLDTPVCDTEVRRFNREASSLGENVAVLVVSMDLPFAQQRWCGAAGVDRVTVLSDHRDASLGHSFGVLIKELRLLARTIFVIDSSGVVRYKQLVTEISEEPDYDEALAAIENVS